MGVAVLHPQDCLRNPLKNQFQGTPFPLKTPKMPNPNPNQNRSSNTQRVAPARNRRRRSPEKSQKISPPLASSPLPVPKNIVMGQVKILRRGEAISKPVPIGGSGASDLGTTGRMGSYPDLVPSHGRVSRAAAGPDPAVTAGFYAGSVVTSPPPSSLPLPGFFTRKSLPLSVNQDEATSDLRRLLGLNLTYLAA